MGGVLLPTRVETDRNQAARQVHRVSVSGKDRQPTGLHAVTLARLTDIFAGRRKAPGARLGRRTVEPCRSSTASAAAAPPSPGTPPAAGRAPDAEGPSIDQQRADAVAAAEATIHPGFVTRADASSWLVDVLQDDPATYPDLTPQAAVEITEAAWTRLAAAQAAWSDEGDYPHVRAAFEELEGRGVLARMNFACCQTCGHSEIGRRAARGLPGLHVLPRAGQ